MKKYDLSNYTLKMKTNLENNDWLKHARKFGDLPDGTPFYIPYKTWFYVKSAGLLHSSGGDNGNAVNIGDGTIHWFEDDELVSVTSAFRPTAC